MTLTPEQLHILQHALGCDEYGQSEYASRWHNRDEKDGCWTYPRNRYVSDPDPDLAALVTAGFMADHGAYELAGGMHYFRVTEKGRDAMIAQSPKPPVLTAGQKRYREWLHADCGMSFGEWLRVRRKYEKDWGVITRK